MATVATAIKLNEHNYRTWMTYFKGRLMAKGLLTTITSTNAAEYHQPTTKVDEIEVSKEWTKLNWNPRQETMQDFLHRFHQLTVRLNEVGIRENDYNQVLKGGRGSSGPPKKTGNCHYCGKNGHWQSDCRKKAREEGTHAGRNHDRNNRSAHAANQEQSSSNVAYLFSAMEVTRNIAENSDPESPETTPPPQLPSAPTNAAPITEPTFEDLTWDWNNRPTREIAVYGERIHVMFFSPSDLESAMLTNFLSNGSPVYPRWMTHPFLVTNYDESAFPFKSLPTTYAGARYKK
ncbi:hypothetical protein DYB37_012158 [Aphanomyces astaci]|uniref:CCHC-type domain-containing protein n=1 Tax=Aphanomyces astaci TaxID=112090 RepID=A0A3R7ABC2_APHAT|nr:hypothetical protein DYB35_011445 [Aphanomyces astaci]RHZ30359.1 hypothetical protein DYB37_012158 [Aphanomyces astaci]